MKREVNSQKKHVITLPPTASGHGIPTANLVFLQMITSSFLRINFTFHAVKQKVINRFVYFLNLREAVILLFKTHVVLLQCCRQKNLQTPRSRPLGFVSQITCNLWYKTGKSLKIDEYVIQTPPVWFISLITSRRSRRPILRDIH